MNLVLFDIDGILLYKKRASGYNEWDIIAKKHFGTGITTMGYVSGFTDRRVLLERLKNSGLKIRASDKRLDRAMRDLGPEIARAIRTGRLAVRKVPGVEKLARKLAAEGLILGLLTGNVYGKARAKLRAAGLWEYFKAGAFGASTTDRSKLVAIAMRDAGRKTGVRFRKGDVFLIGDTAKDIEAARKGGVRIIAVATGHESLEQLKKEKPDYAFKDFSGANAAKIVEALRRP